MHYLKVSEEQDKEKGDLYIILILQNSLRKK